MIEAYGISRITVPGRTVEHVYPYVHVVHLCHHYCDRPIALSKLQYQNSHRKPGDLLRLSSSHLRFLRKSAFTGLLGQEGVKTSNKGEIVAPHQSELQDSFSFVAHRRKYAYVKADSLLPSVGESVSLFTQYGQISKTICKRDRTFKSEWLLIRYLAYE